MMGSSTLRPLLVLLVLVATVVVYLPTIGSYFLADDFRLFAEPLNTASVRGFLVVPEGYIRPLPRLMMRADYLLWGLNTTPAHVINLSLHLAKEKRKSAQHRYPIPSPQNVIPVTRRIPIDQPCNRRDWDSEGPRLARTDAASVWNPLQLGALTEMRSILSTRHMCGDP